MTERKATEYGTVKVAGHTYPAQRNADGAVWYRIRSFALPPVEGSRMAGQVIERTATPEQAATFSATRRPAAVHTAELCDDPECDNEGGPHWALRINGELQEIVYDEALAQAWRNR